ncbi:MAG: hypothetical protein NZ959_10480 [Armatimonadetes bacterium]|nr:hypothetical protein [Armatimonadota bacterium]MDW8122828.1 DUF6785 family protein [Armatimonadota bacterium]
MGRQERTLGSPMPTQDLLRLPVTVGEQEEASFPLKGLLIGFAILPLLVLWIHDAEFRLGGTAGHTALANTSLPVAPFFAFLVLVVLNSLLKRLLPRWRLDRRDLLMVYLVGAATTGIASSGGLHFLVPALASPVYYASPENNWRELIWSHIPQWFIPWEPAVIRGFFIGGQKVPWTDWSRVIFVWSLFLIGVLLTTLFLCLFLYRQWAERERLSFPTAHIAVGLADERRGLWQGRGFLFGFAIPFFIGTWNTAARNLPFLPLIDVRGERFNLEAVFVDRPWNAIGWTPVAFYPFVIGLGYFLTTEILLSCWLFYLIVKVERILAAAFGLDALGRGGFNTYPYTEHQGAGAFLAIIGISLLLGRRHLIKDAGRYGPVPVVIFLVGLFFLIGFALLGGMRLVTATSLILLSLAYMTVATRIRGEVGSPWLFGPQVDPNNLLTTSFGTAALTPRELTVMAFLRNITTFDLRCLPMPHQMDALKMASLSGVSQRAVVTSLFIATVFVVPFAFATVLALLYKLGGSAKADQWRILMGRQPFDQLAAYLRSPVEPDPRESVAVGLGFLVTVLLNGIRSRWVHFPLHPFGYAIANSQTLDRIWLPYTIAWAIKSFVLRYLGTRVYRGLMPFFLGLIVGDFAHGGLWTLIGCLLTNFKVYPMNW